MTANGDGASFRNENVLELDRVVVAQPSECHCAVHFNG